MTTPNYKSDYEVSWSDDGWTDGSWADYSLTKKTYEEIIAAPVKELNLPKEEEFKPFKPLPKVGIDFDMQIDKNGKPTWVTKIKKELTKDIYSDPVTNEHYDTLRDIITAKARKAHIEIPKPKRTRTPSIKKDDRVNTPDGPGKVWIVEKDGTVCVELDKDHDCLHEFEKKDIKKIK